MKAVKIPSTVASVLGYEVSSAGPNAQRNKRISEDIKKYYYSIKGILREFKFKEVSEGNYELRLRGATLYCFQDNKNSPLEFSVSSKSNASLNLYSYRSIDPKSTIEFIEAAVGVASAIAKMAELSNE